MKIDDIVRKASGWVSGRIKEPSSWAAAAAVLLGLSALLSLGGVKWVLIVAVVAGAVGVLLKERS